MRSRRLMCKSPGRMNLLGVLIGLVPAVLPAIASGAAVTIVCGGVVGSFEPCREGAQAWAQASGHEVRVIRSTPGNSAARRLSRDLLAAQADDVDVLEIHMDSAGMLAKYLIDLKSIAGVSKGHFPTALEAFTVDGRLVGLPWYLGVGRLFYRRDLLEKYELRIPQTWEELATSARIVQDGERAAGHREFWGYVFQGRASEELTDNAVEWFTSYGGPGIVATDGSVVVDDPINKTALTQAVSWPGSIAPPSVLTMERAESIRFFTDGNAAFLRYYPSGLVRSEDPTSLVRGRVGMADLPEGAPEGRHPLVLSGFGLAVSRPRPGQRSRRLAHRPRGGETSRAVCRVRPEPPGALRGSRAGGGTSPVPGAAHCTRCGGARPGPHHRHKIRPGKRGSLGGRPSGAFPSRASIYGA